MSTTTLELPDYLAERLNAFATSRGLAPADALAALLDEYDDEDEIDEEAVAELARAIEASKDDPGLPLEEAFDEIRANFRARHRVPAA